MYRLSIKSLGMWRKEALEAVLVSMRNYLMPGGNFFSDHVLKGKIKELACKELVAIVLLSCSCIIVQFWSLKEGMNYLLWMKKDGRGLLVKYLRKKECRIEAKKMAYI